MSLALVGSKAGQQAQACQQGALPAAHPPIHCPPTWVLRDRSSRLKVTVPSALVTVADAPAAAAAGAAGAAALGASAAAAGAAGAAALAAASAGAGAAAALGAGAAGTFAAGAAGAAAAGSLAACCGAALLPAGAAGAGAGAAGAAAGLGASLGAAGGAGACLAAAACSVARAVYRRSARASLPPSAGRLRCRSASSSWPCEKQRQEEMRAGWWPCVRCAHHPRCDAEKPAGRCRSALDPGPQLPASPWKASSARPCWRASRRRRRRRWAPARGGAPAQRWRRVARGRHQSSSLPRSAN